MIEYANRTLIATVVFVDIVGFTKHAVSGQMAIKTRFNEIINKALADVAENERVLLDTGDGAALCFLGDPENALFSAYSLRDAASESAGDTKMTMRIGINLGPIKLIKDINGQTNVIGDAINTAQRIMSFADPQQILVSRSFYELVSCLKPEYAQLFNHVGIRQDKHVREHEVYAIDFGGLIAPSESSHVERTGTLLKKNTPTTTFPLETLTQLENILIKYMGPIAKVLVRKASRECQNFEQLYQHLAESIPADGGQQNAFLLDVASLCGVSHAPAASVASVQGLDARQVAAVEQHLANYIGPLAKILVRRAQVNCGNLTELCTAMAQHIEHEHDRKAFLVTFEQGEIAR